jgi:serine/threonine-protein kinase
MRAGRGRVADLRSDVLEALFPAPDVPGLRVRAVLERRPGVGVTFGGERLADGAPVEVTLFSVWLSHDARFQRRLAAARRHIGLSRPGLAPLLEVGRGDRGRYAVVAAPGGERLDRVLADGPLAPARVLALLEPVAAALETLHARALTHGDLRPRKIHVVRDAGVVAEAGLVDPLRSAHAQPERAGRILAATAPELLAGRAARPWTDVFGLAVVAYECLTGRRPFEPVTASGAEEAIRRTRSERREEGAATEPLERLDAPPELVDTLLRALDREPAARPHSPSALVAELAAALA